MEYTPITPFKRLVDAAVLMHQAHTEQELPAERPDKYEVLKHLTTAREVYELSDRDLAILQGLLSFHQGRTLEGEDSGLIVYPSNRSLCERLQGMPEPTLRRRLARLVGAGIIVRRDSPNGKRYANGFGADKIAFGFDLTPLVIRFEEFRDAAETVRKAAERLKRLRESVSLMRRDLAGLAEYGGRVMPTEADWDNFAAMALSAARDLRRRLGIEQLGALADALREALDQARDVLEPAESIEMIANDAQIERHIQNSSTNSFESEKDDTKIPCDGDAVPRAEPTSAEPEDGNAEGDKALPWPSMPLPLVLGSCREIQLYADSERPIRHWYEFVKAADTVVPMMGISPSAWDDAKARMGPAEAAIVVAAMLERINEIRSPGGYLRALTAKAVAGRFSSGPMVMALMRREAA
ncbi:MAG: replication initiation protein RepC [Boseongicola sp. SB0664_bin_43]|uniref:Replication initiation protein RepC n=1 Tax=Boseongicola sp. SB0664_bin_43 TaxID=2604844 RepID=A0A6B0Y162_9RHOB|nr:replication initiation protein RepC [Boseongicola sp. SB0664_bin_43]MYK33267.1 replication initiation protein RepC [Boseongicola sp. SB0670_bin_30]